MAEFPPPTENLPVFNPAVFPNTGLRELSTKVKAYLDLNYLKFPTTQAQQEVFTSGLKTMTNLEFADGSTMTTAPAGTTPNLSQVLTQGNNANYQIITGVQAFQLIPAQGQASTGQIYDDSTSGTSIMRIDNGTAGIQIGNSSANPISIQGANVTIDGFVNANTIATTYAPLDSPVFTGNPTAPTKPALDNSTSLSTTAYVDNAVASGGIGANPSFNSVTITGTGNGSGINNIVNTGGYASIFGQGGRTTSGSGSNIAIGQSFQIKLNSPITPSSTNAGGIRYEVQMNFWNTSNFYTTSFDIVFFPFRWGGSNWTNNSAPTSYGIYNVNNKINGNGSFNYQDNQYSLYGRQYWTYNQVFEGVSGANGYLRGGTDYCIIELYIPDASYYWSGYCLCKDSQFAENNGKGSRILVITT
jgi:hypothetical protein